MIWAQGNQTPRKIWYVYHVPSVPGIVYFTVKYIALCLLKMMLHHWNPFHYSTNDANKDITKPQTMLQETEVKLQKFLCLCVAIMAFHFIRKTLVKRAFWFWFVQSCQAPPNKSLSFNRMFSISKCTNVYQSSVIDTCHFTKGSVHTFCMQYPINFCIHNI